MFMYNVNDIGVVVLCTHEKQIVVGCDKKQVIGFFNFFSIPTFACFFFVFLT